MSDVPPPIPPSDGRGRPADAVLSAELALGVLDGGAKERAEARAATDDAFAADTADWARRLFPLVEEVRPVEPSPRLWPRIAAGAGIEATAAPAAARSAPTPDAPAAPSPTAVVPFLRSRALSAWRAAAIGGFALAAASLAVAAYVSTRPIAVTAAPLLAAKLAPVSPGPSLIGSEPLFVATLDRARGAVVMTPISPGPVDPRVRELWLIPKGGKPIAAGLLDTGHIRPLPLKPELLKLAEAGATLAISLEPPGGSPKPGPTGPVIAAGVLDRI